MEQDPTRNPAPASDAGVPALSPEAERQAALDAHGFDPAAFDWVPVRRKARVDGWSEEKQRVFIATLADTGSVTLAARAVGMTPKSAYQLRRAPDAAGFDRAWTAAIRQAMNRLIDVCLERALEGSLEPVWDKAGRVLGHKTRYHDRMAMFLLRAHRPELFRDAHRADRAKGEAPAPAPEPVATALQRLDPVPPAAPHALLPPGELVAALQVATIGDGGLPRWRRDPGLVAIEAEAAATPMADDGPDPLIDAELERELEALKHGIGVEPARKPKRARRRATRRTRA